MEMNGQQSLHASQADVWRGLNDPEILRRCIAGCEKIELVSENEYKVVMTAAVGPVKAKFNSRLKLTDILAPHSYSLTFDGSGGAAGFGKGSAKVSLAPVGEAATQLDYSVNASVGGKLAQIGSRLIDGVAKKMAEDFFEKFGREMTAAAPQASLTQPVGDPLNTQSAPIKAEPAITPAAENTHTGVPTPKRQISWLALALAATILIFFIVALTR